MVRFTWEINGKVRLELNLPIPVSPVSTFDNGEMIQLNSKGLNLEKNKRPLITGLRPHLYQEYRILNKIFSRGEKLTNC